MKDGSSSLVRRGFSPRGAVVSGVVAACSMLAACDGESGPRKITKTREITVRPGEEQINASSVERFGDPFGGMGPHGGAHSATGSTDSGSGTATPGAEDFTWTMPKGWSSLPSTQYRVVNLRPANHPDMDCYLSIASGGLLENVNRWRGQFGQPPIEMAALRALPTQKLLGLNAIRVEVEGTFAGMNGPPKEGFKLLGLVADAGGRQIFVKMTGPEVVVDGERANFDAFTASLRMKEADASARRAGSAPPRPAGDASVAAGAGGFDPTKVQCDTPPGWTKQPDRPMRLMTFSVGDGKNTECAVSVYPGDVGGIAANVQRWRGQMGLPDASDQEIAALPTLRVLGVDATVVALFGRFDDSMNQRSIDGARFLGLICTVKDATLFVKLTGPEPEVTAAKDAFMSFCQSLRQ